MALDLFENTDGAVESGDPHSHGQRLSGLRICQMATTQRGPHRTEHDAVTKERYHKELQLQVTHVATPLSKWKHVNLFCRTPRS